MNSNAFFNRIEILLYSTLISAMSGINRLRARLQHAQALPAQPPADFEIETTERADPEKGNSLALTWNSIKEFLVTLLLWIVLGFAAGFLIGMIRPG
jgi:hypothetical protein